MTIANVYTKIDSAKLPVATRKALSKFWETEMKRRGLAYQYDTDGKLCSVEQLGVDFITDTFIWDGAVSEDTTFSTIEELVNSREEEQDIVQFEVDPSKVARLINGPDGLLKQPLYRLIEILYKPNSDQFVIGGGRHRLAALLTILAPVRGYEHMEVPVTVQRAKTVQEVVNYIQASNTSRTMNATEKAQLKTAAKGYSINVFSDVDEIYERAAKMSKVTELKEVSRLLFVAALSDHPVVSRWNPTQNTLGDIGYKIAAGLTKALNNIEPKTADVLTHHVPQGHIYQGVMSNALELLTANWDNLIDTYVKKAKTKRGSTAPETDSEGNIVYEYNLSRFLPAAAAEFVVNAIVEKLGPQLAQRATEMRQKEAEAKKARAAEKKANSIEKEIATLERSIKQFQEMGIVVPEAMLQQVGTKKAELAAKAEKLEEQAEVEPAKPTVPTDMAALLS